MRKRGMGPLGALVLTAVLGVCAAAAGRAGAYFTTYAEAAGGYPLSLGETTEVTEEFSAWTKHVVVTSEEGSGPVYVRARAYCGSGYELTYSDANGKWTPGEDGYYYYSDILYGGESTEELLVRIGNVPAIEDVEDGESFNVVVVYEYTPVRYREDGTPYADWDAAVDPGEGGTVG